MHGHDRAAGSIPSGDLLHRHDIGDVINAGSTPFLRHEHAHETQFAHLGNGLGGKPRRAVPFRAVGGQFLGGKIPRHLADHRLLFGHRHDRLPGNRSAVVVQELAAIAGLQLSDRLAQ